MLGLSMKWLNLTASLLLPMAALAQIPASTPAKPETNTEPQACAACHTKARTQPLTSMAHALESVAECQVLIRNPLLTFQQGPYTYRIERKGGLSFYSVSDGAQTTTVPIAWAMGSSSAVGQTYLFQRDNEFYESRVSFFSALNGLGITIGHESSPPATFAEAAGRRLGPSDTLRCFGCHATRAVKGRQLNLGDMAPGVQCERCHGSSSDHLARALHGDPKVSAINSLGRMTTDDVSDFCGQCHRTWEEIALSGRVDISNVRFQPYRLTQSQCYDGDDRRISCVACHDPHQELDPVAQHYDSKCLACHGGGKPGARACRVAKENCTTCHMPKVDLPGAHHKFSDHRIRVVKLNETFPK